MRERPCFQQIMRAAFHFTIKKVSKPDARFGQSANECATRDAERAGGYFRIKTTGGCRRQQVFNAMPDACRCRHLKPGAFEIAHSAIMQKRIGEG